MNTAIFKAYDIRGRYPEELDEDSARIIGKALARYWRRGTVLVAHDARLSSPMLYAAVIEGLATNPAITVEKIDLATTPMFYFLAHERAAAGGIMVTASHNPKEYNGFKIVGAKTETMSGTAVAELVASL